MSICMVSFQSGGRRHYAYSHSFNTLDEGQLLIVPTSLKFGYAIAEVWDPYHIDSLGYYPERTLKGVISKFDPDGDENEQ